MKVVRSVAVRIPGEPYALKRARTRVIKGKKGSFASHYDPPDNRNWKGYAATFLMEGMAGLDLFAGAVSVSITAVFGLPKSQHRKRKQTPSTYHTKKPDIDNLIKAVLDAATGIVFLDDKQVAKIDCLKIIGYQNEAPYLLVSFVDYEEVMPYEL